MAVCPKCDELVTTTTLHPITAYASSGGSWNVVAYLCPSCDCVLSVGIDPVGLKKDTVAEVLRGLRKH
jgi:hypothetical protein